MCISRKWRVKLFSMSDPRAVVESYLGSIERWPSSVIMDVFVDKPRAAVIKIGTVYLRELCDSDALACYNACNGI